MPPRKAARPRKPYPQDLDKPAWLRLGQLLTRRRIEIDGRYRNLEQFCRERNVDWRACWDIEHARPRNWRRESLVALEVAYKLEPGSIASALTGEDLKPADLTAREKQILDLAPEAFRYLLERDERHGNAV